LKNEHVGSTYVPQAIDKACAVPDFKFSGLTLCADVQYFTSGLNTLSHFTAGQPNFFSIASAWAF
jgi:hypothetical protein